ncbi:MAG: hypothetical protein AAB445_01295 [Patescibacteria group bacterium]
MKVAILGDAIAKPAADAVAEDLAQRLSQPPEQEEKLRLKKSPRHKLLITGSHDGTPNAIRCGAMHAECRHVSTHYVEILSTSVFDAYTPSAGYFYHRYNSFAERANFVSAASSIVFFTLNRTNIGTALTLLYEQSQAAASVLAERPALRTLLFWDEIFHQHNGGISLEELQRHFGNAVDASDSEHIKLFHTAAEAEAHINAFEKTLLVRY